MSLVEALPPLRETIAAHGLSARKALGQNFLLDLNLTRRIAREAGPLAGRTVYEVGPGPGGLTRALLLEGAARVVAMDADNRIAQVLAGLVAAAEGRFDLHQGDALAADEAALTGAGTAIIVSNLPYHIGTALLVKWLTAGTWPAWFDSATLMFQKEVAERIVAPPGGGDYGRLSVLAQWRMRPRLLFDVNRSAFTPPPNVTSAVVRLDVNPSPAPVALKALEAVTAAAFGQRRKMLRAALKSLTPEPLALLEAAGLDPQARAEQIPVAGFVALAQAWAERAHLTR
jgi:16S rRNA (adenine1518-N6/adenine1519-N6)-dimethyltransferase